MMISQGFEQTFLLAKRHAQNSAFQIMHKYNTIFIIIQICYWRDTKDGD